MVGRLDSGLLVLAAGASLRLEWDRSAPWIPHVPIMPETRGGDLNGRMRDVAGTSPAAFLALACTGAYTVVDALRAEGDQRDFRPGEGRALAIDVEFSA